MVKIAKLNTSYLLLSLLPFGYWVFLQLGQDLWWDELISLREYALASLEINLTVNPIMNNHILSNLLINLYTRLISNRDFYDLIGSPSTLRVFQLLISTLALVYNFKIYHKFVDRQSWFVSTALLVSCIPFLNFSLQLRGYSLSMMLLLAVVYHTYSYKKHARTKDLIFLFVGVFGVLFTLASNTYVIISFYIVFFLCELREVKMKSESSWFKAPSKLLSSRHHLHLLLCLIASTVLTYIAYLPTISDLLTNRFVDYQPDNRLFVLDTRLVDVVVYLFSKRWILLFFLLALPYSLFKTKQIENPALLITLTTSTLLPFFLALFHGTAPYERTFVVVAPLFNLSFSIVIYNVMSHLRLPEKYERLSYLALIAFLSIWSMKEIRANDQALVNNADNGTKEQSIYRNFYHASNFIPNRISERLKSLRADEARVLLINEIDRVSLGYYLIKNDIPSSSPVTFEQFSTLRNNKVYNSRMLVQKVLNRDSEVSFANFIYNLEENQVLNKYELMTFINNDSIQHDELFILTSESASLMESTTINHYFDIRLKDRTGFVKIFRLTKKG